MKKINELLYDFIMRYYYVKPRIKSLKEDIIADLDLPCKDSEYKTISVEEVAQIIEKRFKEIGI